MGCRDQGDVYRFVRLMAAGDNVAAARLFVEEKSACLLYRGGSTVEIERESTLQFKMTCARQKGEPECRWLASDLVTAP